MRSKIHGLDVLTGRSGQGRRGVCVALVAPPSADELRTLRAAAAQGQGSLCAQNAAKLVRAGIGIVLVLVLLVVLVVC
jgi:hypothetical protein